ncbi:MAG: hypothetical protein JSV52_12505, partial [Candidatus Zixiibacteriota bacterium]
MSDDWGLFPEGAGLPLWNSVPRQACPSRFPQGKTGFLGGNEDEIIPSPTFVGWNCRFVTDRPPFFLKVLLAKVYKRGQNIDMPTALAQLNKLETGKRQPVRLDKRFSTIRWFNPELDYAVRRETYRPVAVRHTKENPYGKRPEDPKVPQGLIKTTMKLAHPYQTYTNLYDFLQYITRLPWLGILYADQVRVRPVGPVLGQLLYTLGLAPLEETTLTQKSWTKRETMFEEVEDREAESTLEYDSSWSTSFTNQFSEEWSRKTKAEIGTKFGVDIKGITASIGASYSSEDGYKQTASEQIQTTRALSKKVTQRAKKQHKTTFKVTTEVGEEFTSQRVLRNSNPDRSLELHFHKVMQKLHVSLERHDAHMALRLCVPNPARRLREAVLTEIGKFDPVLDPEKGPQLLASQWSKGVTYTQYAGGGWEVGNEVNTKKFSINLPDNYCLSRIEGPIFIKAKNENGDEVYPGDYDGYEDAGGRVEFKSVPALGAEGLLEFEVEVEYAEPSWWINGTDVSQVTYEVKVYAVLTNQYSEDYRQRREQWEAEERERIRETFSLDRLKILSSDDALIDYVNSRLIEMFFLTGYFGSELEPPCKLVSGIKEWFLWESSEIDMMPWWLTPSGFRY